MARSITANIGEKIEIRNTENELMGYFYFNPADMDIIRRCDAASQNIEEIQKELNRNLDPAKIQEVNDKLRENLESIIGNKSASVLFEYNSPLAVMPDGTIYGIYLFDIIFNFISEEINARKKSAKQQMDKYTAKYEKK